MSPTHYFYRVDDYKRIAKVIQYLDNHFREQPDLKTLAGVAGLSAFYFHRLFHRWAGITPNAFLQSLTLQAAKRQLKNGSSVLHSSFGAGLSGPGRLHDLCVSLEAATPGEIKSGGAGLTISAGYAATPFGHALLAQSSRGIFHISFPGQKTQWPKEWTRLKKSWPGAVFIREDKKAAALAHKIFFQGALVGPGKPLNAFVRGTPFQVKVWKALLKIPMGRLASYRQVAAKIGHRQGARAVGTAIGKNTLGFLIPCHRVISASGLFGNYRWGPDRKKIMIAWETGKTLS